MIKKTLIFALLCTSLALVSAEDDDLLGDFFKDIVEIPGKGFKAISNIGKDVFENVKGVVGDVGQTVGDVVNEKIQLGSRGVNKVAKVFESVGNEVGNVFKDGDLSQMFGRSFGAAGNIVKSVASESMDGVKDVMSTGGKIIKRKFDLGKQSIKRVSNVIANGVDQAGKIFEGYQGTTSRPPLFEYQTPDPKPLLPNGGNSVELKPVPSGGSLELKPVPSGGSLELKPDIPSDDEV